MTTSAAQYTMATTCDRAFDDAIDLVTARLADEGFGVLTTIDVKKTLKTKIDEDVEPYTILGACNPQLAHKGMQAEPELGALLPCNVIVRQVGETVHVAAMEPVVALGLIGNEKLEPIAQDAHDRLKRVIDGL